MNKRLLLAASIIIILAGTALPTAVPAQPQGLWPWAPQIAGKPWVQKVGMLDWLLPKKKSEPQQMPEQTPEQTPKQKPVEKQQRRQPGAAGGTYRTLCVRTCDGYYYPISNKATRSKFDTDSIACLQRCTGEEARLFVHRNPGQEVSAAVDLQGNRYVDLDNAFRYRKELVEGCGC